ncbi:MAG: ATP-binding protein, partial [Chloroflexota bacterium]
LGPNAEPFENLRIFAPFRPNMTPQPGPGFKVMLDSLDRDALRLGLNTERNARGEAHVIHPILWDAGRLLQQPHKFFDRVDLDDKMFGLAYDLRDEGISSLAELGVRLDAIVDELSAEGAEQTWRGHHRYTIQKFRNRVRSLDHKFGGLLGAGQVMQGNAPSPSGAFTDQEMRVIDISQCKSHVQEVLVSSIVSEIWRMAEDGTLGVRHLVIFVDELNKYAPGGGEGALRDTLVDIAARGRHLNVVLFGAQQFRSKVDDEILGNCGTAFYGRIGDEEIVNAAYRSLSETTKAELLGLPKGRLLVRHAHFRAPLLGAFPMPPTVPGIVGQRVYNDEGAILAQHPGDILSATLQRLLGSRALSREELREKADGLDSGQVLALARKIEDQARRGLKTGMDPNRMASNGLSRIRQQYGQQG